jgi:hypothetical protein
MLKQIGPYVSIITTEYMSHVSLILLVPCLNIYLHPLYVLKISLTSRQPHPLYVLTLGLATRPPCSLDVLTIGLSTRPPHPLYLLTIDLTTRPSSLCRYYRLSQDTTAALCMSSSFKNEVIRPLRNANRFNQETITHALCD